MARIRPHGRETVTPAGKAGYCLLLLLALCASACQRQPESSIHIVSAAPAGALAASFQRFPAASDTDISSWMPDANNAASKSLAVRSDGGKAALLRFDLPQELPIALERAVLRLYVLRAGRLPLALRAYPLLRSWDARAANWRQFASGRFWSLPGASDAGRDRASEPAATALVSVADAWLELDLTAVAREWLAYPERNMGLLLTGAALEAVECELASVERGAEQAPVLELTFSAKPAATAAASVAIVCGAERGLVDTGISASFPEANLAAHPTLELSADGSRAILMRLTNLPKEGALEKATLQLYAVSGGPGSVSISAYQAARDWQPQQATWQRALADAKWASPGAQFPGADFASAAASMASLERAGDWVEFDITEMALSWLEHPELNDGLILRASGGSPLTYTFASVESPLVEQRPRLKLLFR